VGMRNHKRRNGLRKSASTSSLALFRVASCKHACQLVSVWWKSHLRSYGPLVHPIDKVYGLIWLMGDKAILTHKLSGQSLTHKRSD
jgi:hypothetical protein